MSKHKLSLVMLVVAGFWVAPSMANDAGTGAHADTVGTLEAANSAASGCSEANITFATELELAITQMRTFGCPNWRCTNALQCGWECGESRPTCSNPSGVSCAGWCICY